jgi:hypothetical protein
MVKGEADELSRRPCAKGPVDGEAVARMLRKKRPKLRKRLN